MSTYFLTKFLPLTFDDALGLTRGALAAEGFGIPVEMDTQAIFKAKLGRESERRIILGACLPEMAFEAMKAEPEMSVLLPCNVTIREVNGGSEITAVKPTALMGLASRLDPAYAEAVENRLQAALDRLPVKNK